MHDITNCFSCSHTATQVIARQHTIVALAATTVAIHQNEKSGVVCTPGVSGSMSPYPTVVKVTYASRQRDGLSFIQVQSNITALSNDAWCRIQGAR